MKKLKDLLPFIAYDVALQLVERDRNFRVYDYIFAGDLFIDRGAIEKNYPELLERELSDGIHAEGIRDGVYIPLYR